MMIGRSKQQYSTQLPTYNSHQNDYHKHSFGAYGIGIDRRNSNNTMTNPNGIAKYLATLGVMIIVCVLGYVESHIKDHHHHHHIDHHGIYEKAHEAAGDDYPTPTENLHEAQQSDLRDVDFETDDDFRDEEHSWRDAYQYNGHPLDHVPEIHHAEDEYTLVESEAPFLVPELELGQMSPLYWADTNTQVDPYTRVVNLPPRLTYEIQDFCRQIGLYKLFQWAAHSDTMDPGETLISGSDDLLKGHNWAVTRAEFGPEEDLESNNLHWLDAVDEFGFEATVDVLKRGRFDDVLDTIAAEFKPWGYMFAGMGFMVATHSEMSRIHKDNTGGGKDFFNLVFPIHLPEHNAAQLYIASEDNKKVAPFDLEYDQGLLISADTVHGTADCDYRRDGSYRVFASIYIADIHSHNVDIIANDNTALFPLPGHIDWLLAQRGRFWGGTDGGSFKFDRGRAHFHPKDEWDDCKELAERGLCWEHSDEPEHDPTLWSVRTRCPVSCEIYMDPHEYDNVRSAQAYSEQPHTDD